MRSKNYPRNNRWAKRHDRAKRQKHLPAILLCRILCSPDPAVRHNAFWQWYGDSWRTETLKIARDVMFRDPDHWVRERATYVLAFHFGDRSDQRWETRALLRLYKKADEHQRVRAQAAEGLANNMTYWGRCARRKDPLYRSAVKALLEGLNDPSPHVRFWSVFALWQIQPQEALPELERLAATDHAICPGWWTVAEEASDAVASMRNENVIGSNRPMQRDTLTPEDICPY